MIDKHQDVNVVRTFKDGTGSFEVVKMYSLHDCLQELLTLNPFYSNVTLQTTNGSEHRFQLKEI